MPKLERLDWIAPLSDGKGVTLSDDPDANKFLAEDANALLLGVLYDSQYLTVKAFASPLRLKDRLGELDMRSIAEEDPEILASRFRERPAIHRFPNKFAGLTQKVASVIVDRYDGDAANIWQTSGNVDELAERLMELPAFGVEKTNWTVGMLGKLGYLPFGGWEDYRVKTKARARAS